MISLRGGEYLLVALCWRTPGLIYEVEEGVEIGGVELPVIRT